MRRLLKLLINQGPMRADMKFKRPKAKLSHMATAAVNPDWVKISME